MSEPTPRPICDYPDQQPAVARVSWTAYGGRPVYRYVCAYHEKVARGQRGITIAPVTITPAQNEGAGS